MSELLVRKIVGDEFEYQRIFEVFKDDEVIKYQKWVYDGFARICNKSMTRELNSEWITRHYLATKMILSASVMLTSLDYAVRKNLKISVPYLSYYAILTCCRAVIFTLPEVAWGQKLIKMTHDKILKQVKNCLKKINNDYGDEFYQDLVAYRNYRELFSYKFPAQGPNVMLNEKYDKTIEICRLLCEIAQLNSQEIERYVAKHCFYNMNEWKSLDYEYIRYCFCYEFHNEEFRILDFEDIKRINYIQRRQPFPVSLYYTMSEGMVEDFFGSWCREDLDEESNEDMYNPYCDWRIIFPCP